MKYSLYNDVIHVPQWSYEDQNYANYEKTFVIHKVSNSLFSNPAFVFVLKMFYVN